VRKELRTTQDQARRLLRKGGSCQETSEARVQEERRKGAVEIWTWE
jgi:hypothetical protein